jgi:multicomponent Na+:H+ antiporter subunit G
MIALAQVLAGLMLVAGSLFALVAAVGLLRFPDLYTRMHAASKAGPLAAGLMLLALALEARDLGVGSRAVAGVVFFLLTAPISAHLLARAAYLVGIRPWPDDAPDELAGSRAAGASDTAPR